MLFNIEGFDNLSRVALLLKAKGLKQLSWVKIVPKNYESLGIEKYELDQLSKQMANLDIDGFFSYGEGESFSLVRKGYFNPVGYRFIPGSVRNFDCEWSASIQCNSNISYTKHITGNWYLYRADY